jgi:hypothetical protein
MIRQYSMVRDGDKQLTKNFKVREFACKDGTDIILIDDRLFELLQTLRDHFKRSIRITSGYRTRAYNMHIGGNVNSKHMTGQAADIDVGSGDSLVDPLLVAMTAQAIGSHGIGCYQYADGRSWVHVGSSFTGHCWRQAAPGAQVYIDTFLPTLRKQTMAAVADDFCLVLQSLLKARGLYSTGALDGKYGAKTLAAVKAYQKQQGLEVDGVCGPKTWHSILL